MNRVLRSYSIHELYSTRKARKSEAISSKSKEKKIRRYHPLKYLDVIYSPLSNEFTAFITLYCIIKQLLPTLWWYAAVPLVWISCQFNVYKLSSNKIMAVFFVWLCMVWLCTAVTILLSPLHRPIWLTCNYNMKLLLLHHLT